MAEYSIGTLASAADVSVETVRFYERRGLLEQPERPGAGYRRYGDDALERLRVIRRAKDLGFTLAEIAELLVAAESGSAAAVLRAATATLARVDAEIAELSARRDRLEQLAVTCLAGDRSCITLGC